MQFKTPSKFLYTNATILVLIIFLSGNKLVAQTEKQFPIPINQLFYLQRNANINTLIYELNIENGKLNTTNPIRVFWIMYTQNEKRENLSEMEKDFVYGIKVKPLQKQEYQFTLAAYPKISLLLSQDVNQKYHVYATPSKNQIIVSKVYIKIKDAHFKLEPTVEYIEFTGTDVISGNEITEKIIP